MINLTLTVDLAVVPVFVNTGAALLPALVAGLASFVSILFKPKQLIRVCREKPLRPLGVLAAGVAIWLAVIWMPTGDLEADDGGQPPGPANAATAAMMTPADWVRLAQNPPDRDTLQGDASALTSLLSGPGAEAMYFRGGNARSGYLGGPSPTKLANRWIYEEELAMFWSSPLVRDSRVYAAWCILDPPGNYGAIVCLDAKTGERLWEVATKSGNRDFGGFFSSPALTADGKSLVIGQGLHPDYDSELVCIDTATETVRWLIDCPLHIESSPAIAGDIVVVGAGAIEDASTHKPKPHSDPTKDRNPGYVFAARISTGEIIWKHTVADPESSPAVADGVVYIGSGFNGNAVTALRLTETDEQLAAGGLTREIWRTATPFPATGAITLTDEMVLVGCGNGDYVFQAPEPAGAVLALDPKTGKTLWTHSMADGVLGPIAVVNQTAIVPVRNGEIVALDLGAENEQARVLWRTVPRKGSRALAGTAFTGTHVYALTHDGFLFVLDAKTGKTLEQVYVNGDPGEEGMSIASPVVVDGHVYVGSETGGMRCYGNGK